MIKRNSKGQFVKGFSSWNKGIKGATGENAAHWKGDNIGYHGIHRWLIREYGNADKCESPECNDISTTFQWALLKEKEYERKRENFIMLCASCHKLYDFTEEARKKMSLAKKGCVAPIGSFKEEHIPWNKGLKLTNL